MRMAHIMCIMYVLDDFGVSILGCAREIGYTINGWKAYRVLRHNR